MLDWLSQSRLREERKHAGHCPSRGQLLRDYTLLSHRGDSVQLSDFRGKSNLLIIALPEALTSPQTRLLLSLAKKFDEVRQNETLVLVVTRPEHLSTVVNLGGDFVFLSDQGGLAMLELGAVDSPVIYVTDKFREILTRHDTESGLGLPSASDILKWARYAALECPACDPPAWPAQEAA